MVQRRSDSNADADADADADAKAWWKRALRIDKVPASKYFQILGQTWSESPKVRVDGQITSL